MMAELARRRRNKRQRIARRSSTEVYRSLGLVRGKDSLGRVIWE